MSLGVKFGSVLDQKMIATRKKWVGPKIAKMSKEFKTALIQ